MPDSHAIEMFSSGDLNCAVCQCGWARKAPHNNADANARLAKLIELHLSSAFTGRAYPAASGNEAHSG